MQSILHAHCAGRCPPTSTSDEAPTGDTARGFKGERERDSADFRADGIARQAADVIEGEQYARAYLDRLQRGTVSPDDLAVLMSFLHGEMLAGACRAIEKALGVQRYA